MSENYFADFLVERPPTQRIWVVRASGGDYVRHFLKHGLVAIGHIDELALAAGEVSASTLEKLGEALKRKFPDKPRSSVTSHVNQVKSFCKDIAADDIVVTVTSRSLIIGRVTGTAYVDSAPLFYTDVNRVEYELKQSLRRNVEWGPEISRRNVPAALEMTMLAHQTVFNLDKYWDSIYHLLYPCFRFGDRLYLSTNIRQASALDNYSISQLFGLLSGVEAAAREFDAIGENAEDIDVAQLSSNNLNLTSKAEFMSPGAIWSTVMMDSTTMVWCVVIYIMLFGGDVKFFKADGLIDKQMRQKALTLAMKLFEKYKFSEVRKKLEVDIPRVDTKALKTAPPRRASRKKVTLDDGPPADP